MYTNPEDQEVQYKPTKVVPERISLGQIVQVRKSVEDHGNWRIPDHAGETGRVLELNDGMLTLGFQDGDIQGYLYTHINTKLGREFKLLASRLPDRRTAWAAMAAVRENLPAAVSNIYDHDTWENSTKVKGVRMIRLRLFRGRTQEQIDQWIANAMPLLDRLPQGSWIIRSLTVWYWGGTSEMPKLMHDDLKNNVLVIYYRSR